MVRNAFWLSLMGLMMIGPGYAQTPVITQQGNVTSTNASSTIAVTNTFQSIWAATGTGPKRQSCLVLNNSTNRQWVYFGAIAGATKAKSVPLEPASATSAQGGFVNCSADGVTLQDQVSITGTAGDTFMAAQQ